jgi:hypothetical protein
MSDSDLSGDQAGVPAQAEGLGAMARGTARDLRTLQGKLTHVGSQSKPTPTVVFSTFYHIVDME